MDTGASLVTLLGMPRSGTTLVYSMISSHSQVGGISEPFQSRRDQPYEETDPAKLCEDFKVAPERRQQLLLKETTTRPVNISLSFDVMKEARKAKVFTGAIVLLRHPVECYASQVEASAKFWKLKKMTEISEETFTVFARSSLLGFKIMGEQLRAHAFRFMSYAAHCDAIANSTSRCMALFPLRMEPEQISNFRNNSPSVGDPKLKENGARIVLTDRSAEVEDIRKRFASTPCAAFYDAMAELESGVANRMSNDDAFDELVRITQHDWRF